MARDAVVLFTQDEGKKLIQRHCRRIGLPVADLRRLIDEVIDKSTMQRRRGLWEAFDEILDNANNEEAGQP
ncbi:MAG: hypothetical protein ACOVN5_09755 [Aquidulcibacter sp.]